MSPAVAPLAIVGGTALSYLIAAALGIPALVPILNTVPAFPFMVAALRRGQIGDAVVRMWIWAATLAVCATAMSYWDTAAAGRLFINGENYRREMFTFVLTGVGAEGNIRQFLPQHALHATIFCVLALATGSLAAMPMGAVLMNYMGYYVGSLAAAGARPAAIVVLAWVPWALVRIASFVVLGVVLAGPALGRWLRFPYGLRAERRWVGLALAGLGLDVLMKWTLAHAWRDMIRSAAGW